MNPVTAWQLGREPARAGEAHALGSRGARRRLEPLVLAACLEATLIVGGVGWMTRHLTAETDAAAASLQRADAVWCGSSSLVDHRR